MKIARLLPLSLLVALPSFAASAINLVTIDTSSLLSPTIGYVDWSFNAGGSPADNAAAVISNFTGPALGAIANSQATIGSLPGPLTISNANGDYEVNVTFARQIQFYLQFTGPAVDNASRSGSGSTFSLALLNATQDGAYLTSNVNDGYLLQFNLSNTGQITPVTFPNADGGPSVVNLQTLPEPPTCLLAGFGIAAAEIIRRRQARVTSA